MLTKPPLSPLTVSSTKHHSKSWLLSLSQLHTSSYFSLENSLKKPFFPSKSTKSKLFPKKNPEMVLNFPSDNVVKPYTIAERWLINVDLPIMDDGSEWSRSESSPQKTMQRKRKKKKNLTRIKNIVKRHAMGFSSIENLDFFKHYYRLLIKNIFVLRNKSPLKTPRIPEKEKVPQKEPQKEKDYIPVRVRNFLLEKTKQDLLFFEKLISIYETNNNIRNFLGYSEYIDSNKFDKINDKLSFLPKLQISKSQPQNQRKSLRLHYNTLEIKQNMVPQSQGRVFKEDDFLQNLLRKIRDKKVRELNEVELDGLKQVTEEKRDILKVMEHEFKRLDDKEKVDKEAKIIKENDKNDMNPKEERPKVSIIKKEDGEMINEGKEEKTLNNAHESRIDRWENSGYANDSIQLSEQGKHENKKSAGEKEKTMGEGENIQSKGILKKEKVVTSTINQTPNVVLVGKKEEKVRMSSTESSPLKNSSDQQQHHQKKPSKIEKLKLPSISISADKKPHPSIKNHQKNQSMASSHTRDSGKDQLIKLENKSTEKVSSPSKFKPPKKSQKHLKTASKTTHPTKSDQSPSPDKIPVKNVVLTDVPDVSNLQTIETTHKPSEPAILDSSHSKSDNHSFIMKSSKNSDLQNKLPNQNRASIDNSISDSPDNSSIMSQSMPESYKVAFHHIQNLLKEESTSPLLKEQPKKPSVFRSQGNPNKLNKNSLVFLENQQKLRSLYQEPTADIPEEKQNLLVPATPIDKPIDRTLNTSFSSVSSSASMKMAGIAQELYQEMRRKKSEAKETEEKRLKEHKASIESHFNVASKRMQMTNRMTVKDFEKHQDMLESLLEQNLMENGNFLEKIQAQILNANSGEDVGSVKILKEEILEVEEKEDKPIESTTKKHEGVNRRISMENMRFKTNVRKFAARQSVFPKIERIVVPEEEKKPKEELLIPDKVEEKIKQNNDKIQKMEELEFNLRSAFLKKEEPKKELFNLKEVDAELEQLQEDLGISVSATVKGRGAVKKPEKKVVPKKALAVEIKNIAKDKPQGKPKEPKKNIEFSENLVKIPEKTAKNNDKIVKKQPENNQKKPETILEKPTEPSQKEPEITIKKPEIPIKPPLLETHPKSSLLPQKLSEALPKPQRQSLSPILDPNPQVTPDITKPSKPKDSIIIEFPKPPVLPEKILKPSTDFLRPSSQASPQDSQVSLSQSKKSVSIVDPASQPLPPQNTVKPAITPKEPIKDTQKKESLVDLVFKQRIPDKVESFKRIPIIEQETSTGPKLEEKKPLNTTLNNISSVATEDQKVPPQTNLNKPQNPNMSSFQEITIKIASNQEFDLDKALGDATYEKTTPQPSNVSLENPAKNPLSMKKSAFSATQSFGKSPMSKQISAKSAKISVFPAPGNEPPKERSLTQLASNTSINNTMQQSKNTPRSPKKTFTSPLMEEARLQALIVKQHKEEIQQFLRTMNENIEDNVLNQNPCIDRLHGIFEETSQSLRKLGKGLDHNHLKFSNQIKNPMGMRGSEIEMRKKIKAFEKDQEQPSDDELDAPIIRVAGDFMGEQIRKKAFMRQQRVMSLVKRFLQKARNIVKQSNIEEPLGYVGGLGLGGSNDPTMVLGKSIEVTDDGGEREEYDEKKEGRVEMEENKEGKKEKWSRKEARSEEEIGQRKKETGGKRKKEDGRKFDRFFEKSKKRFKLKIVF